MALQALAEAGVAVEPAPVSPAMLKAGRKAFMRERRKLDDLWEFFDSDLDQFLAKIYRAMREVV